MTSWMKNQTVNLLVSASISALAERLQSIRETDSLSYYRVVQNIVYGRERLKDIVKKAWEEEEET